VSTPHAETLPLATVEGFEDVRVLQPGIQFYLDRVQRRAPFAFLKRTHGFWDRVVDLMEVLPDYPWISSKQGLRRHRALDRLLRRIAPQRIEDPALDEARERLRDISLSETMIEELTSRSSFKSFWRGHFIHDLIGDIQSPLADENYFESIAFSGFPGGGARGRHDVRLLRHAWRVIWANQRLPHDALVWKRSVIDGGFREFLHALDGFSIVLIGPGHLSSFAEQVGWDDMRHVEIHPTAAIAQRESILERCRQELEAARGRRSDVAVIYQAGSLAVWLIRRLWPDFRDQFHLDLGMVLDPWYPEIVSRQRWFRDHKQAVIGHLGLQDLYETER